MTWITALLPLLIPLLREISHAWGSATGNSLQKVGSLIAHAPQELVDELTSVGSSLFPSLDPTLHAAAAALLAAESHTGAASWVQAALNFAPSNAKLKVDGIWGPKSIAALKAFQTTHNLPTTGMFADAELAALAAVLAKI